MTDPLDTLLTEVFSNSFGVTLTYAPSSGSFECVLHGVLYANRICDFFRTGDTPASALRTALDHAYYLQTIPTTDPPPDRPHDLLAQLGLSLPPPPTQTPRRLP